MLDRLFPRQLDNVYRGHWLGLVLFVLVVSVKAVQSVMSIVETRTIATGADGISLSGYGVAQADMVLSLFALLGLSGLIIPLLSAVALVRYRAMIPLVYLVLLIFLLANRALRMLHPAFAARGVTPIGFYINLAILGVTLLGFVLSLTDGARHDRTPSPTV